MPEKREQTMTDTIQSEHCQCPACSEGVIHSSDCAVHNGPAFPVGQCDCDATSAPAMVDSLAERVLSFAPQLVGVSSREPSIEHLIRRYYRDNLDDEDDAEHYASDYISRLRASLQSLGGDAGVSEIPLTCKHSDRSDCGLFGIGESASSFPLKKERPSREWYASKIQETLNEDFVIGAERFKTDECDRLPEGWRCTREKGHDGPCAALSLTSTDKSDGWLPIETAPRSGEEMLLWWCNAGIGLGGYVADERGEGWMCDGDQVIPHNQKDCLYWRALPAAPKAAEKSGRSE